MSGPDALSVSRQMKNMVNQQDVDAIIKAQQVTLQRLERSNAMLSSCNRLSLQQLALASENFSRHTDMLLEMRKDLQSIFSRIRALKSKLKTQYPGEFSMALEDEVQNVSIQASGIENETSSSAGNTELYPSASKSHFSGNGGN